MTEYHSIKCSISEAKRLLGKIPKSVFWDVDVEVLSPERDSYFIVRRIMNRAIGSVELFEIIDQIYSIDLIEKVALNSRQIRGNETIKDIANRYNLNPRDFKQWIDLADPVISKSDSSETD